MVLLVLTAVVDATDPSEVLLLRLLLLLLLSSLLMGWC